MDTMLYESGLRAIFVPCRSTAAAVVFGLDGGAWYDPPRKRELHHLFEHVLSRETLQYPSWEFFTRECDSISTGMDAETDETSVVFFCVSLRRHVPRLIALFAEMALSPLFARESVACETARLREESHYSLSRKFDSLMFPSRYPRRYADGPSGISYQPRTLRLLHEELVVGERAVIAVAGSFDEQKAFDAIEESFRQMRRGAPSRLRWANYADVRRTIFLKEESSPSVRCIIGFPTFGFSHPDRIALGVVRNYFSARSSSRLGVRLDAEGKGYEAQDYLWFFRDAGQYSFEFTARREKFLPALRAVAEEIRALRERGVPSPELRHTKKCIELDARIRFSDPRRTALFYARQWLNLRQTIPLREYLKSMRSVRAHDTVRAARTVFAPERIIIAASGSFADITKRDILSALTFV